MVSSSCATTPPGPYDADGSSVTGNVFRPSGVTRDEDGVDYTLLALKPRRRREKFPMVLVFHGSGGNNRRYLETWKEEAVKRRFMVASPAWQDDEKVRRGVRYDLQEFNRLVDEIARRQPVDKNRTFLAGVSAGGLMARWLLEKDPPRWEKAVFIGYATRERWVENVSDPSSFPPLLFVHGGKDTQFSSELVQEQTNALIRKGIEAEWLEYPEGGHEHRPEWNKDIFDWLEEKS